MAQLANVMSERMSIRLNAADKQILMKAVALTHTNITEFVLQRVLPSAKEIVKEHEQSTLSPTDLNFILDLLDNPPAPNERLKSAAALAKGLYND